MTVDAAHLDLFSRLNREGLNAIESASAAQHPYWTPAPVGYGASSMHGSPVMAEASTIPLHASRVMNPAAETSDLTTYNVPPTATFSRKRCREFPSAVSFAAVAPSPSTAPHTTCPADAFTFLGEDVSLQILKQQLEIDCFVSQHMEMVRAEMEGMRRRQCRRILASAEALAMMKLRAKEEEIDGLRKLNAAMEERAKSLHVENQIWKELAHTTEATVHTLRSGIQQALAEAAVRQCRAAPGDAESSSGSNDAGNGGFEVTSGVDGERRRRGLGCCRSCGTEEAVVLLLPCRHLCLCASCGPTLHVCPVCSAQKTASVHVNLC